MMDSFSPTLKWTDSGPAWSCEIEVSHMGKKPISYRQRWEKMTFLRLLFLKLYTHLCAFLWHPKNHLPTVEEAEITGVTDDEALEVAIKC